MAKKQRSTSRSAAPRAPKPKHVTVQAGQRVHLHVVDKAGKPVAEFIGGADPDGLFTSSRAPEEAPPAVTPNPVSGT